VVGDSFRGRNAIALKQSLGRVLVGDVMIVGEHVVQANIVITAIAWYLLHVKNTGR
jgi:hypothetical protein